MHGLVMLRIVTLTSVGNVARRNIGGLWDRNSSIAGNVGIGTTGPGRRSCVYGNSAADIGPELWLTPFNADAGAYRT